MATYTIDTPGDFNYYEDVVLAGHAQVTSVPGSGDTINLFNDSVCTIDTDMLNGSPFSHYLLNLNLNSITLLVEGRNVRHVKVTSESGTPPSAIGDNVYFSGGASGKFLRFHTIDGIKYMKLRSLDAAVADGESITTDGDYAATTVDADHVGTLELAQHYSTDMGAQYSPENALLQSRGEWFYLRDSAGDVWQSDGTDSQTLEHYTEDMVQCISVETGNGTDEWELYINICAQAFTDFTVDEWKKCFKKANADATITLGAVADGNFVPPLGARIRVPNIHIGCANSGLTGWNTATSSQLLHDGMRYDLEKLCLGSMGFFFDQGSHGSKTRNLATDVFFGGSTGNNNLRWQNCIVAFDALWTRCGGTNQINGGGTGDGTMFHSQNTNGEATLEMVECKFANHSANAGVFYQNDPAPLGIIGTNCHLLCAERATGVNAAAALNFGYNGIVQFDGLSNTGDGPSLLRVLSGSSLKNVLLSSRSTIVEASINNHQGLYLEHVEDFVLDGLTLGDNNKWQRMVLDMNFCSGCIIKKVGGGDWTNPDDFSDVSYNSNSVMGIDTISSIDCVFAQWSIKGAGSGQQLNVSGQVRCTWQNCLFQLNETVDGYTGLASFNCTGTNFKSCRVSDGTMVSNAASFPGIYMWDSYKQSMMFSDFFYSDTEGLILLTFTEDSHADFTNAPSAIENSIGAVSITTQNEYIVYESHLILGHTGFAATDILGWFGRYNNNTINGNALDYDWDYQIDTGSGWSSWATLMDASDGSHSLNALSVDPADGFKLRVRITRNNAAGDLSLLRGILIYTTTTWADQRDNLHPLPAAYTFSATGIPAGATIRMYADDNPDPQEIGTLLDEVAGFGGGTYSYNHDGTTGPAILQVYATGYKEANLSQNLTTSDNSIIVKLEVDDLI